MHQETSQDRLVNGVDLTGAAGRGASSTAGGTARSCGRRSGGCSTSCCRGCGCRGSRLPRTRSGAPLAPLWGDGRPVWLEIGFGAGEHLVAQAAAHPDVGLHRLRAVRQRRGDGARADRGGGSRQRPAAPRRRARPDRAPAGGRRSRGCSCSIPIPGRRRGTTGGGSRARRTSRLLHRVMAPGAELRLATDIPDYVEHALAAVAAAPGFRLARDTGAALAGLAGDPLRGQGARGGAAAAST